MRAVWLVLLLVVPRTAGAQPSRVAVRLPIPAAALADSLQLTSARPSTILLDAIRLAYASADPQTLQRGGAGLARAIDRSVAATGEIAPLPLAPDVWRSVILGAPVPDDRLVSAILRDRSAALMYLGLSALDDDTLAWLAARPDVIRHIRARAAAFAAFGRSVHIRDGAVAVPGRGDAQVLWRALVAADPGSPADFIGRLFAGDGRLAFFYDTVAHLDAPRQRFALGLYLPAPVREERLRALMRAFATASPEWRADERPFARPPFDGAVLLSAIDVLPDGNVAPPGDRRLWERLFRGDALAEVPFADISTFTHDETPATIDASWLAANVLTVPYAVGRRRLDVLLFAQRTFGPRHDSDLAPIATALRGYEAFPALTLSLERMGITEPAAYAAASRCAAKLGDVTVLPVRRTAIAAFQSAAAVILRARLSGALAPWRAAALIASLSSLDVSPRDGYGGRFVTWFRDELVHALPPSPSGTIDDTVTAALAGPRPAVLPRITWEDRSYLVDPADAELRRLRRVRGQQGGRALDAALTNDATLGDALIALVYAVHLGDPDGTAAMTDAVAARHDFGLSPSGSAAAWALPVEEFDKRTAWRIRGSLLGLETALSGLALRRINATEMPPEPLIAPHDRQTMMLTAALLNPAAMTDEARDGIVAAIGRGRARVTALAADADLEAISRDAALSEWRRHALEWDLARGTAEVGSRFSLLELLWLGSAATGMPDGWDAWGAAALPRTGCLCLTMPRPRPWEEDAGYAVGLLGTRAADVALRAAEMLAEMQLPASLAPALVRYTMQDVLDHARLSRPDDWEEFGRAARELSRERLADEISALAAGGPLVAR